MGSAVSDFFSMRASSISDWLDCAYRAEGKYLLGMRLPSSGAAHLGTSIHYGTAQFDHAKVERSPISTTDATDAFVEKLHHPDEAVNWGDQSVKEAERVGVRLTSRYCTEYSPRYEFRAVEMTTDPLEIEIKGFRLRLTGTMDRTRVYRIGEDGANETKPGIGIIDLKSGKRAVRKDGQAEAGPHIFQLGAYEILAAHTLGESVTQPAGIIGLQTTKEPRIGTAVVTGAREALLGKPGEVGVLEMLAADLKAGTFRPNPRSALCSERYCARWNSCAFHA